MERNIHLEKIGECVYEIRKRLKMSQVEFYKFLFPHTDKELENIKKKMNAIENGKQKSVDFDFLLTLCRKCEVSADYLFGIDKDYRNHEAALVCKYTGLEENAVEHLHAWKQGVDNGADLSELGKGIWIADTDEDIKKISMKIAGLEFLKIINYLFRSSNGSGKKKGTPHSNLRILHYLSLLTMSNPIKIQGKLLLSTEQKKFFEDVPDYILEDAGLDCDSFLRIVDDNNINYFYRGKDILQQIAREHLREEIDALINQVKQENENKQ